ncbi:carbohydrate ABC transporter permease [Thermus thermophilus]|uniref:carbohydrate ABC transporter permease n=1 Tax=Thermus thermophilus TaxID=274 RepID=UPI001FCC3B3C|nr:carbohydrate ABC transporter permease [Thermus thermophilus]BDG29793.1 ABC transporter permease [Thermus thermophilus]
MTPRTALAKTRPARPGLRGARGLLREVPALLVGLPFLALAAFTLLAAFTPTESLNRGEVGALTLENLRLAWASADFPRLYLNTALFAFGLLLVQLFTVTTAGFALAQLGARGNNLAFHLVLLQLFLPPSALILPNFLTLKALGLTDSLVGLALPYVASATGAFLLRQGFRQIPKELVEAALVDGATPWQVLSRVLAPANLPALVALGITLFIGAWNQFVWPGLVANHPDMYVLTVAVQRFAGGEGSNAWGPLMAASVLATLPALALYLLFRRPILETLMEGGVRG